MQCRINFDRRHITFTLHGGNYGEREKFILHPDRNRYRLFVPVNLLHIPAQISLTDAEAGKDVFHAFKFDG